MLRQPILDRWQFARLTDGDLNEICLADALNARGESISLPHTMAKDGQPWRGNAVYRRLIQTDPRWKNVFVEFEAVDQCCRVFIDDIEAGGHRGGYSRFRVQVPREALQKPAFEIAVLVTNTVNEHVSPHFGDFTVYGGIPRPVHLLICGETHFDYLYHGTDGLILRTAVDAAGNGILTAEPHLINASCALLTLSVWEDQARPIALKSASISEPTQLILPKVKLWDGRKSSMLYTVEAALTVDGQAVDSVTLKTGFRRIEADGRGLRLNGQPCFLRGVAKHQDRAKALTAVAPEQIAQDFDLIDEIGANAVRLSHYQHSQAAYDACDKRGILCWAEIPMLKMTEDEALQENARQQLTELILQNIHHPSVYCWGIQNEIAMFRDAPFMHEACRALNDLAHRLDPGRLTACANLYPVPPESKLNGITDLVGYNYYFGWYYGAFGDYGKALDAFHAARPDTPVGITEYGADANLALHSADPKCKDYSEEYQALYHESVYPFLKARPWLWGSYVWNMFDFSSDRRNEGGTKGVNAKGLVTWDRTVRKDAFYYYKAQWSDAPFLHICGRRYAKRAADAVTVKVYTNCPEATLTVNGQPFGKAANSGNGTVTFENVSLRFGSNAVVVSNQDITDEITLERVGKEPEGYRLPDTGTGNVLNWFLQGEQKADCFSIACTAQQVLENPRASAVLREQTPGLYRVLTEQSVIPLGLMLRSILSRDTKDPEQIQRINKLLQEIPLKGSEDRRE